MADGVSKDVYPYPQDFGRSYQLLQNKFFDPSTPTMRKGCNGEKNGGKNGGENGGETGEKNRKKRKDG